MLEIGKAACSYNADPLDWGLRGLFVAAVLLAILCAFDDRRTRPKPETIRALADDMERTHGSRALGLAIDAVLAIRHNRDATRYRILKAVVKELEGRSRRRLNARL